MRVFIITLFAAALCALGLQADPIITLVPAGGQIWGGPDSTVGWGLTLTVPSSENDYIVLTGSSFSFSGPAYGTYTDYVDNEFIFGGPGSSQAVDFDPASGTGAGQFTIFATSPGDTVIPGDLTIHYDGYSDNTFSNQTIFDQTVVLPASVNITPEPASFWLVMIPLLVAFAMRRRAWLR